MKIFSVAIFGSSIRMDFDKYSDKDLLVVSDSFSEVKELISQYESKGLSVTFYTYKKLQHLAYKQSLFIEHLKRESFIFIDSLYRLKTFLQNVPPIAASKERIQEAKEYFHAFDFIPLTSSGFGWFCDAFYVGFRNYLINLSASNGSYKFSYMDLVRDIHYAKQINDSEFEILRQLRVVKGNFRNKTYSELPTKDFIEKVVKFICKMGLIQRISLVEKPTVANIVKSKLANSQTNYYQKLRLLEIYYYMSDVNLPNIEKLITNPQSYANILKADNFILEQFHKIDAKKTTHHIWRDAMATERI